MSTGRPITSDASAAPYRLRNIMLRHGIAQRDLRQRLVYASGHRVGQTVAAATVSMLLTRRQWPQTIARQDIEQATTELLTQRGVPEPDIAEAWLIDGVVDETDASEPQPPPDPPFELPETEMLSIEAREHFQLAQHPFKDDVNGPEDVYLSREQRYVRESMYYAAKHSGLLAVCGESGSGKSTLRRDLIDRIRRDDESIVVIQPQTIDKRALSAAHICDAIVADLSTERPRLSLEAKGRQVQRVLAGSSASGNTHVLIIEEAHDLNIQTLKYLKRFWELEDGFKKLLGIILVGQPELADKLDERRNYEAREVIRRCEIATLRALNGNLEDYLALKFKRIGASVDNVFDKDAFDAIRERLTRHSQSRKQSESFLYPLVVQNLCAKAMNAAVELGMPKVNAELLEKI